MNDKSKVAVLKFGGESVATPERIRQVAEYVMRRQQAGSQIVAVVSARVGTTDEILELFQAICPAAPDREYDQGLATGEQLAAALLAGTICTLGGKAKSLVAQQMKLLVGGAYRRGRVLEIGGAEQMREDLAAGTILVCAGFQGVRDDGDVVTLGRGGSDITAVVEAHEFGTLCEVFKDVDGVYAVDPHLIPEARRFGYAPYRDMVDLSSAGAKVLAHRAVLLAQRLHVPIRVLLSPSIGQTTGGTLISFRDDNHQFLEEDSERTYLAVRKKVAVITASNLPNQPGEAAKIFKALEDVVIGGAIQGRSGEQANISSWVNLEDIPKVKSRLPGLEVQTDCACLTLIRLAMQEELGYLARLTVALGTVGVNIEMQATSENSISVIVHDTEVQQAVEALASEFGLCR